ncbi:DNA polymerase processivity factor [Vibrio phage EniLVp02]
MKLTKNTIEILSAFSAINNSMTLFPGMKIYTQDNNSKILASADVDVEFPKEVYIYDLGNFLSALNLVNEPEITFNDTHMTVKASDGSGSHFNYGYGEAEFMPEVTKELNFPQDPRNVTCVLQFSSLQKVLKAANTFGVEFLAFSTKKGSDKLELRTFGKSNCYSITLAEVPTDHEYDFVFSIDRFAGFLKETYEVTLNPEGISSFTGADVQYYVVMETETKHVNS